MNRRQNLRWVCNKCGNEGSLSLDSASTLTCMVEGINEQHNAVSQKCEAQQLLCDIPRLHKRKRPYTPVRKPQMPS
jgi:hypothetical protein